jgi:hypothetical protein
VPRKLRTPKERRYGVDVHPALYAYLLWRDLDAATRLAAGDEEVLLDLFVCSPARMSEVWRAIEADALQEWIVSRPGQRPRSWWLYSAPELRRVTGRFTEVAGVGRCQLTGIPYGAPDDWNDRPLVESTPAYLDRLGLWLPGERERVERTAFEPQPFSWQLTDEREPPGA